MIRVAYREARWQGHSVLWSLGFSIFDLKLPDRRHDEPYILATEATTQPELKQADSSLLNKLRRQF